MTVEPFRAIGVSRLAHQLKTEGRSIIHMEFGQPSTGAPESGATSPNWVARVRRCPASSGRSRSMRNMASRAGAWS